MQTKIQDQKDVPHLTDPMLLGVWVWVFSLTDLFYFDKDFYILGARGWGMGGGVCVWRLSIFWTGGRIDGPLKPSCDLGFVPNWKHWCSWRKQSSLLIFVHLSIPLSILPSYTCTTIHTLTARSPSQSLSHCKADYHTNLVPLLCARFWRLRELMQNTCAQ